MMFKNTYLHFKAIVLISFLILPLLTSADRPHYDIIEVMYNGKKYFIVEYFNEGGVLKNNDLCYYDYSGEYIGEVQDFVMLYRQNEDSITIYSSMEKINVRKLVCYEEYIDDETEHFDDILKIFNGEVRVPINQFKKQFILVDAYHGNTVGYTYTPDLKETDNIWLSQYPIENIFCLEGIDICHYSFFTIKGNLSKTDKIKLKDEMIYLLSSNEMDSGFWEKISELNNRQIIMVGFCSC